MKKLLCAALMFVIGILASEMDQNVFASNDWEYRNTASIKAPLTEKFDLNVNNELYFKDDMSEHYYTHLEAGVDWKMRDWFILSPYFREKVQISNGDWETEHRLHLNGTFKWKLAEFSLSDRNRIEYRIFEDESKWRYRNQLKLIPPIKWTRFEITPWIADEIFYDFEADELNANRIKLGISCKLAKYLKGDIYYTLESTKSDGDWTDKNVFWTGIKLSF